MLMYLFKLSSKKFSVKQSDANYYLTFLEFIALNYGFRNLKEL